MSVFVLQAHHSNIRTVILLVCHPQVYTSPASPIELVLGSICLWKKKKKKLLCIQEYVRHSLVAGLVRG